MYNKMFFRILLVVGMVFSIGAISAVDDGKPSLKQSDLKDIFKSQKKEDLSGVYAVTGSSFGASGKKKDYKAVVVFNKTNAPKETYMINYVSGNSSYTGMALRTGDKLAISWKMEETNSVALLNVNEDGSLKGTWFTDSAIGEETYLPVNMPKDWVEYGKKKD